MGHLMGIRPFFNKGRYDEVHRELNRAQAKDRKVERQSEKAGNHLRVLLSGEDSHDLTKTEYYLCLQKHIPFVRDTFAKHVIRRTLDSVDYRQQKIFGMKPYQEHIMLLELRQWERQALSVLTDQMLESKPAITVVSSTSVSFYSSVPFLRFSSLCPKTSSRAGASDVFRDFFRCFRSVPVFLSRNAVLTIPSEFLYRHPPWTPTSTYEPSYHHR